MPPAARLKTIPPIVNPKFADPPVRPPWTIIEPATSRLIPLLVVSEADPVHCVTVDPCAAFTVCPVKVS